MRRIASMSMVLMIVLMMCCSVAFAAPAQSLDDVVNQPTQNNTQQQEVENDTTNQGETSLGDSSTQKEAKGFINDLGSASDMTGENETVAKAAAPLKRIVSIIVQLISYVITFGLTLRVVLDLAFIAVPFLRTILANGHQGNPQTGANTMGNPMGGGMGGFGGGMGMSPMGGMGMGGMGRFGGGMGGFGGGMGMSPMGGTTNPGANDMGSQLNRIQWVSSAALNAVAAETTVGPDGKPVNPYKIYAKDMIVVMVLTPIMLVLAVTGTLTELGFLLGELISRLIGNLGGMM